MSEANIHEIFSGIQGEGLYVGRRHLFVRFSCCNLSCRYCDTPGARRPVKLAEIERRVGRREFDDVPNPISSADLADRVLSLDTPPFHRSICLTGGEPLLQAECISELLARCPDRHIYLETNGSLPDKLVEVIDLVDTVAMDIKLESAAGCAVEPEVSLRFLELAARREVFVKVVVSGAARPDAVNRVARLVASVDRSIPLVLQPVTAGAAGIGPILPDRMLELQERCLGELDDVRVIPQTHRILGQR